MKHQFERLNIQLTRQQKAALEKLSAVTGAPVAALIRFAVDDYIKKQERSR